MFWASSQYRYTRTPENARGTGRTAASSSGRSENSRQAWLSILKRTRLRTTVGSLAATDGPTRLTRRCGVRRRARQLCAVTRLGRALDSMASTSSRSPLSTSNPTFAPTPQRGGRLGRGPRIRMIGVCARATRRRRRHRPTRRVHLHSARRTRRTNGAPTPQMIPRSHGRGFADAAGVGSAGGGAPSAGALGAPVSVPSAATPPPACWPPQHPHPTPPPAHDAAHKTPSPHDSLPVQAPLLRYRIRCCSR